MDKNEQIKQVIEGFTCLMRGMWNNPNLTVPKDIAEKYNIDKKFYEKEETENNEHSEFIVKD